MTQDNEKWRLQKIELEFQQFGEHKGKYIGKIKFMNGEWESFDFKIRPEMADSYIKLISEDVVKCADSLANRLVDSLNIRNK